MQSYHQVIISVIASILLVAFLLSYRYLFPKKGINLLYLLLALSCILCISIFRQGGYQSGDFNIHIFRTIEFYSSLAEGHFFPAWAGNLNATYGYPLFIFNYPLPYYLLSFLHLLSLSFITSMKVFLALNIIFSGLFMYLYARSHLKNNVAGFITAIFYLFVPYHLVDVHFKVVIGEILFFTFLPLTFYFIDKSNSRKFSYVILAGICFGLLILSHIAIALFTAALLLAYSIVFRQGISLTRKLFYTATSMVIASAMTVYVWGVPLYMSQFTVYSKMLTKTVGSIPLGQLIYSPYRYGFLFQGHFGEITNIIGYTQLIVVFLLLYKVIFARKKNKTDAKPILFWLGVFLLQVYLITPYADLIWKAIPFLTNLGNHRLLILVAFATSLMAGYLSLLYRKNQLFLTILTALTVGYTILNWGQRTVLPNVADTSLVKLLPASTAHGEGHFYADPKGVNIHTLWFSENPKAHYEVVTGSATIKAVSRRSTEHDFIINATTDASIRDNTLYFPGWTVLVDNNKTTINYERSTLIDFNLPKGLHFIKVEYQDLELYTYMKYFSLFSTIVVLAALLISYLKEKEIDFIF